MMILSLSLKLRFGVDRIVVSESKLVLYQNEYIRNAYGEFTEYNVRYLCLL